MTSTKTADKTEWAGQSKMYRQCPDMTKDGQSGRHWGPDGAAGALCWTVAADGRPFVLLAKRSAHVQQGGTWAFPGGAVDQHESPLDAAIRELFEEVEGVEPDSMTAVLEAPCEHGCGWQYTTFVVRSSGDPQRRNNLPKVQVSGDAYNAWETSAVAWVPIAYVTELNLHPGLAATWPAIRELVEAAANKVR